MGTVLGWVEDAVFEQVLGERSGPVEDAVVAERLVGEKSLNLVAERVAALFDTSKGDALKLLGVSRRVAKGKRPSPHAGHSAPVVSWFNSRCRTTPG
jgi:hypothetical protein